MPIKIRIISVAVVISVCASFSQALTNYYVVPPPNAGITPPYTNWAWAATNIQDVVNIALGGDTIYITNGHYYLANQITVSKGVIIRSFNNGIIDPTNTIIDGNQYAGKPVSNRCMYITSTATVDGLTLTNGSDSYNDSGGAGCAMTAGLLTNCIITGNNATNRPNGCGGGISGSGSPIIANCQLIGNTTMNWGGGIYMGGGVLKNSVIVWNYSKNNIGAGVGLSGGAVLDCDIVSNNGVAIHFISTRAVVSNCTIRANTNCTAFNYSGYSGYNNIITHSSIIDNYGASGVGGTIALGTTVRNCLIARNKATGSGGGLLISDVSAGYVESCTIVSNYAPTAGGVYTYTGSSGIFSNTIVCSNTSSGSYKDLYAPGGTTNYFYYSCCKTVALPPAQGNVQSDPLFVDVNSGNYRLSRNSPCKNVGTNQAWMADSFDMDGRRRLDRYSGIVDMGCYEYVPGGSMYNFR